MAKASGESLEKLEDMIVRAAEFDGGARPRRKGRDRRRNLRSGPGD